MCLSFLMTSSPYPTVRCLMNSAEEIDDETLKFHLQQAFNMAVVVTLFFKPLHHSGVNFRDWRIVNSLKLSEVESYRRKGTVPIDGKQIDESNAILVEFVIFESEIYVFVKFIFVAGPTCWWILDDPYNLL